MRHSDDPEAIRPRKTRGRPFVAGNSGRKPGSKNKTTLVAESLLEGETEELVRTAVALAKGGDVAMLKFLLGRILPKERSVRVELPPTDGDFDAVAAMEAILVAATTGQILPSEASELASIVAAYARTLDITELRLRLENVEKRSWSSKTMISRSLRHRLSKTEKRIATALKEREKNEKKAIKEHNPRSPSCDCGCCNRLGRSTKNR